MRTCKFARGFFIAPRLAGIALLLAPWLAVCAHAQVSRVHEQTFDWYVMRSSIVGATILSAASARAYGVKRAADVAVLQVAIMRRSGRPPGARPAKVQAVSLNLARQRQKIDMRASQSGGAIVYVGSFRFVPGELRTFIIRAEPLGSNQVLEMAYDERLWRRSQAGQADPVDSDGMPLAAAGEVERRGRASQEGR